MKAKKQANKNKIETKHRSRGANEKNKVVRV